MTLVLSVLTKHGFINLSDSNIHYENSKKVDEHKKIWRIASCDATISIFGAYEVEGVMLDQWMPKFIKEQEALGVRHIDKFASVFQNRLELQKNTTNSRSGQIFQIAGFSPRGNKAYTELWTVQDFEYGVDPKTRDYKQRSKDSLPTFLHWEHCWKEISRNNALRKRVGTGQGYWQYCNGTKGGRLALGIIIGDLLRCFNRIYENSLIDFRPPQGLNEQAKLLELYVPIIEALYATSNYDKAYIGGNRQVELIHRPPHAKY